MQSYKRKFRFHIGYVLKEFFTYRLKFRFHNLCNPYLKYVMGIHPDILSYLAVFVTLGTGFCFYFSSERPSLLILAIILIFLRMILNALDGMIATARGNLRLKGEIINALPDRYSDIFMMLGITFSQTCNTKIGAIATVLVLLVSYTGMLGKAIGMEWQHQGPLGKVERFTFILIAAFLQFIFSKKGITPSPTVFDWLMIWFIVGSQISVLMRVRGAMIEVHEKEGKNGLNSK